MKKQYIGLAMGLILSLTACGSEAIFSSDSSSQGSESLSTSQEGSSSAQGQGSSSEQAPNSEQTSSSEQAPSSESQNNTSQNDSSSQNESSEEEVKQFTVSDVDHVRVFCTSTYSTLYAWLGDGAGATKLLGEWPGSSSALKQYEDTNWKYYDFDKQYTTVNFIFSVNGGSQTADLKATAAGNYWYANGKLEKTNTSPKVEASQGGNQSWQGAPGTIFKDPEGYKQPSNLPDVNVTEVASAKDYSELPAVKNFSGTVINKYNGSRTDFRDESIYFTITTRFYDGDKNNNTHCWDSKNDSSKDPNWRGDFKGLIEKMDYIKALGFTAIWITPVVKNASGFDYHGYHAINFKEVDPRYESEDVSFQTVINEAHKRDMKIILDVVFNHTSNFGEENLFPMFYYDAANNTSLRGLVRRPQSKGGILPDTYDTTNNPGGMRFDYLKTATGDPKGIYHHDPDGSLSWEQYSEQTGQIAGDCVDLNTENPTVANYLVEAYAQYIKMGVDAFRIDTMKHINRLTLNKYFFPAFKAIAKKCRNDDNFHMFGEVCVKDTDVWNRGQQSDSVPFYTWNETKNYAWGDTATNAASAKQHWSDYLMPTNALTSDNAYLRSGFTYHAPDHSKWSGNSVIDFPMHWNFDNARNSFGVAVSKDQYYNDATYNVVYVDSHDYSPNEGQTHRYDRGTNAWKENMSLMFTFRGVPCVYYGSEVEFKAGVTIDNGPNLALENSGRAYFGDYLEGDVKATGFGVYTASGKVKNTLDATLSKHLQKLNQARLSCIALRRGQYSTSNVSGSAMAFVRRYNDSVAAVAISGNASFSGLPNGTYKDLYNGGTYPVTNGSLSCNTPSSGVCIFVKQ